MSAKWRALQHRHKYTYNAVVFPSSYLNSLHQNPNPSSPFHHNLVQFTTLTSTYSQLTLAKNLAASFINLINNESKPDSGPEIVIVSKLYFELLFLENSSPLHRTLLSVLPKVKNFHEILSGSFREVVEEYSNGKGKRFAVSRVALSVMGLAKLGYLNDVVEFCAVLVAADVVRSLNGVVLETNVDLSRPSPIVMEQCQDGMSCLYYLLQKFPSKFSCGDENGIAIDGFSSVMEGIVSVVLSLMGSDAFSRDCFVAAGVALCAALQVCISSEELGLVLMQGIFNLKVSDSSSVGNVDCCDSEFMNAVRKVPCKGDDVYRRICSISVLSRICLIRGILTAVSRNLLNTQFSVVDGCEGSVKKKSILYDGILPELCRHCESPTDSHFNFHALTVMQICLQQIKTSMLSNLTDLSGDYDPIPEEMGMRILRIIWNNLEDSLSQTVKQVHLIFDLFMDIQSSLRWSEGDKQIKVFLGKIGADLLSLGSRCKGRYIPLALLTKRLGAKKMLDMCPDLLFETIHAYVDDDVCCAATSFLKCFLEYLRDECWEMDGIEGGYALYRGYCLPPIMYGLASGFSKHRTNLNTYALPVLLEIDVDSIFPMLSFVSVGPDGDEKGLQYPELVCANLELNLEQKIAILVSLLKVSRSLALVEGDIDWCENPSTNEEEHGIGTQSHALVCIKGIDIKIHVLWLVNALTHVDESLRVDAAESLFLNPKTSSLPSHLELTLMKEAVPLNMRCCSTAFQMKWGSLFRKFFSRVRTALERQFKQGSCANVKGITLRPPDFALPIEELKSTISKNTRAILLNTPHNPTGKMFTREELNTIASLCIENDVLVFTDEVYDKLAFDMEHISIASLPGMFDRTVTMNSLGKTFSLTGWKIGWAIAPPHLTWGVRQAHAFLTFATSNPMQWAAAVALRAPDSYYTELKRDYMEKRAILVEGLKAVGFKVFPSTGTYFVVVDHTPFGHENDVAFCEYLVKEVGVVAIPTSVFYLNPEDGKNLVRFTFCKDEGTLRAAVERMKEKLRK